MADQGERVIHKNLREAILAVMHEVPYLLKEQKPGLDYKVLMEGEVIGNIHPAFVKHGIVMHPAPGGKVEYSALQEVGKYKNIWMHVIISQHYIIRHVDTDEAIEVVSFGEAMNAGDKAIGAAQTYALKYALRQALLIESGDDPDKKSAATMERRKSIKLDESAAKAERALLATTKKADMLRYRKAYLARGFDHDTITHLEGIFWTNFNLCTGDEPAPDLNAEPAFKGREKPAAAAADGGRL